MVQLPVGHTAVLGRNPIGGTSSLGESLLPISEVSEGIVYVMGSQPGGDFAPQDIWQCHDREEVVLLASFG